MTPVGAELDEIERVYRSRGGDFFRLAYALTADVDAARDAVQEGFAHAVRGRHAYRASGVLDAWIGRCVLNAARDLTRRRRLPDEPEPLETSLGTTEPSVDGTAVRAAVRELPQRQRDVLFLRFYRFRPPRGSRIGATSSLAPAPKRSCAAAPVAAACAGDT
jgi:DNA-directed RNA polymerase specialized sigma24 family protein